MVLTGWNRSRPTQMAVAPSNTSMAAPMALSIWMTGVELLSSGSTVFSFRIMVGLGMLMIAAALWGLWLRRKNPQFENKAFLLLMNMLIPAGVICTLAGWYVTEVGRQPWLVQGLVRTMEVVTPLPAERVMFSLTLFVVTYSTLLLVYLYFMAKLVRKGPPDLARLEQHMMDVNAPSFALEWVKKLQREVVED